MKIDRSTLLIALFCIATAIFVYFMYSAKASVLWDEAVFLYWSYQIYDALRIQNIHQFISVIQNQFRYPPLQSLFLGTALIPFGFTIVNARMISLFWFVLSGILTYTLGTMVETMHPKRIGFIALFFFLTSPLLLYLASIATKEMMGISLILTSIIVYILARERKKSILYFSTGLCLAFLFMTKYHYAVFVSIGIFIESIILFITHRKRLSIVINHMLIAVPLLAVMLGWIFYPTNNLVLFMETMSNATLNFNGGIADVMTYILFYPRSIIYMYSPSPYIGILFITGFIITVAFLKNWRLRFLWIIFLLNIVSVSIHTINVQDRYIATSIPFLFILCGNLINRMIIAVSKIRNMYLSKIFFSAGFLIVLFLLYDMRKLPRFVYSVSARASLAPTFDQPDYTDTWFGYNTDLWPKKLPSQNNNTAEEIVKYIAASVDPTKPIGIAGFTNNLSQDYFNIMFALAKESGKYAHHAYSSYEITIELDPGSRYRTLEYATMLANREYLIQNIQQDPSLSLIEKKYFSDIGITVSLYGRI